MMRNGINGSRSSSSCNASSIWRIISSDPGKAESSPDFDEIGDAIEVSNQLRRGFDRGLCAAIQAAMNLVRPLGPDLAAAALGQLYKIAAALVNGLDDR